MRGAASQKLSCVGPSPRRLAVQVSTLSRWQHGFESRRGYLVRGGLPVVFAALVLATPASATPGSTSFKITGYEYAFTSTVGSFAGRGTGNTGDSGFWNATVNHDRLGLRSAFVNGGTFVITVKKATGGLDAVAGTFVHHGGTIATLKPGANCTNQQYRVTAKLQDVLTPSSSGGSGMLSATLTHYRLRALGRCLAYKARVAGSVSLTY
jgi:hypothetical protein